MALSQIFQVATEFRFEIGGALLGSQRLQQEVGKLSDAADNTLLSFQRLGVGIVASLGLGSGGFLGLMTKAIQVSDKFQMSALGFSNIISGNMDKLQGTIGSFNDRLSVSKAILLDIAKVANDFSLDEGALLNMTKILAPVLIPHGAAGTNFKNAIDLSRNVLKASPTLGLDPNEIQGQLVRTMMGQASMGDTLFRRLVSETSAFQGLGKGGKAGGSSAAFNALSFEKRFEMLHKGLNQFASDMDVINGTANTLNGNMQRFKSLTGGLNSILKPLGDSILPPLLQIFREFNNILDNQIRDVLKNLSSIFRSLAEDPKGLIVNLMQIRNLSKDVKSGGGLVGAAGIFMLLRHLALIPALQPAFAILAVGVAVIGRTALGLAAMVPWMTVFSTIVGVAWFALSKLLVPLAAAVGMFQIISRAKAIAQIEDAKAFLELSPKLTALFVRLKDALGQIFLPFTILFDEIANLISPLFQMTFWLGNILPMFEAFVSLLETLGTVVVMAMAGFQGLVFGILQIFDNLKSGNFTNLLGGVGDAFDAGVTASLEKNMTRLNEEGNGVSNQVTNIAKIEIRNDFKEQQEPDRIAFTLKDQLLKAAQNPTQSRGSSFQGAFAR